MRAEGTQRDADLEGSQGGDDLGGIVGMKWCPLINDRQSVQYSTVLVHSR